MNKFIISLGTAIALIRVGLVTLHADTGAAVNSGATDLSSGSSYTPAGVPTVANDVQFASTTYTSTSFDVNGSALMIGTLNDLDATQSLTISNSNGTGSISLSTTSNSTSGSNSSDLLFVASAGNLTLQNGVGTLALNINASGSIDNAGTLSLSVPVNLAAATTFNGAGNTQISGVIAGAGSVMSTSTGTISFSGANTYSGGTTISSGTLSIINSAVDGSNDFLGLGSGTVTVNGGILEFGENGHNTTSTFSLLNNIVLSGGAIYSADAYDTLGSATSTITINSGSSTSYIGATFNIKALTVAGLLQGSGNLTLQQASILATGYTTGDTVQFTNPGTSTYNGTITIGNDNLTTLVLDSSNALASATINVQNAYGNTADGFTGVPLAFGNGITSATIGGLTSGGGGIFNPAGVKLQNTGGGALALSLGNNNTNQIYAGVLSGSGSLIKIGTGTQTLTGANTYSGGTTISGGILSLDGGATATSDYEGFGSGGITVNGGILEFGQTNSTTSSFYLLNNVVLSGGAIYSTDGDNHLGNASSTLTINAGSSTSYIGGTFNNKELYIDALLQGSGNVTLKQASAFASSYQGSTVHFTNAGTSTYNGTITIANDGFTTLLIDAQNALANATINVQNAQGNVNDGYTNIPLGFGNSITSATIGGLSSGGVSSPSGVKLQNTSGGALALTIGNNNTNQTFAGVLSGSGSLTMVGTGSQILTGVNTYTGSTTVNGGTLQISGTGALKNTASVSVNTGGSLLFGTTTSTPSTSPVSLNGGTLGFVASTGGKSVGMGALTLGSSSTIDFGSGRTGSSNNTFTFASLAGLAAGATLTITDYLTNGLYGPGATTDSSSFNQDRLLLTAEYGTSLGTQLSQIVFYNSSGQQLGFGEEVAFGSQFEIVPTTPEPSTLLASFLLLFLCCISFCKTKCCYQ